MIEKIETVELTNEILAPNGNHHPTPAATFSWDF
jgi:hypothetical protein